VPRSSKSKASVTGVAKSAKGQATAMSASTKKRARTAVARYKAKKRR
jgi:hypothetical protein